MWCSCAKESVRRRVSRQRVAGRRARKPARRRQAQGRARERLSRVVFAKPHHVQLLVRGGEVHRRAGAVVLRPEVRVRVHDLRARARRYPGRREGWPACVASPRAAPWPAAPGRPGARWSRRQTAGSATAAGSAPCLRGARRRFSAPALGSWRGASAGRGAKRTGHVAPHGCWTARERADGPVGAERACVMSGPGRQARGNAWKGDRHVRLDGQRAAGTQRPPDVACQRCALAQAVQRHRQRTCQRPASVRASKQRGANGALPSSQQWW